jgi:hypothetical protein
VRTSWRKKANLPPSLNLGVCWKDNQKRRA